MAMGQRQAWPWSEGLPAWSQAGAGWGLGLRGHEGLQAQLGDPRPGRGQKSRESKAETVADQEAQRILGRTLGPWA